VRPLLRRRGLLPDEDELAFDFSVGVRGALRARARHFARASLNPDMHIYLVVWKKKSYFEEWTNNELLKIGSFKLFAWPFGTATPPDKGADIDYNHD
jgi:hypothetical protein